MADIGSVLGGLGIGGGIGRAIVTLELSTSKYLAEMKSAEAQTAKSTQAMGATTKAAGTGLSTFGTAGVAAIGLLGAASIKLAVDFDRSFTRIAAISNTSAGAIEGMKSQVLALSGETAQAPTELADALFFLASAGLDASEVMPALEASAKASAVGLGETADVANIVASALNAYAGTGLTAAKATDVLVAAVREGRAEPEEFATALGRILPIAATVGVTFDQVAASMATLSNIGLDVTEGTTAMRGVLQAIAAPGKQAAEALDTLGLSSQGLLDAISQDGIIGAIRELDAAAREQTDTDAEYNNILRQVIPNIRALTGVLGLTTQEGEKVDAIFERILHSNGALGDAFKTTAESDAFQLQKAMNDLTVAGTQLGSSILPTLATVLKVTADNAGFLVAAFGAWLIVAKGLPLILTAVQAGTAALAGLFPTLTNNLMAIGGAANFAKSAMLGLTAILTVGVTAALIALPALVDNFSISLKQMAKDAGFTADFLVDLDSQLSFTANLFNAVSFSGFVSMLDGTRDQVQAVTEALIPLYGALQTAGLSAGSAEDYLQTFTDGMREATGPAIADLTERIQEQITLITALQHSLGAGEIDLGIFTDRMLALGFTTEEATALAEGGLDAFGKTVSKTGRVVKQFGGMSEDALKDFKADVVESVQVTAGQFESLNDAFATTPKELQKQMALAVRIARTQQRDLREIFADKSLSEDAKAALASLPADQRHAWAEGGKAAKNQIEKDAVTLKNLNERTFREITRGATDTAKSGGKTLGAAIPAGAAEGVRSGAGAVSSAVRKMVADALAAGHEEAEAESPSKVMHRLGLDLTTGLWKGISDGAQKVIDTERKLVEKVLEGFKKDLDKVKGLASSFADAIKGAFSGFMDIGGLWTQGMDAFTSAQEKYVQEQEKFADDQKAYLQAQSKYLEDWANYQLALKKRSGDMPYPTAPTAPEAPTAPTAPGAGPDLSTIIQSQVAAAQDLAEVLRELQRRGAGKELLQQVAAQGVEFGQAVLAGGKEQIQEANKALADIAKMANLTGKGLSEEFFGKKIDHLTAKVEKQNDILKDLLAVEKLGHEHAIILDGEVVSVTNERGLTRILNRKGSLFDGAVKK